LSSAWGRSAPGAAAAVAAAAIGRSVGPSCQCRRMGRRRKGERVRGGLGVNVIPFCWRGCAADCGPTFYPQVVANLNRSFSRPLCTMINGSVKSC
jgi:hypothetical protein